jgi:hypothetical protein
MEKYRPKNGFYRYWWMLDRMSNAVLGGKWNRTISARLGYWYYKEGGLRKVAAAPLVKFLDLFEKDHCLKAMVADDEKRLRKGL